MTRLFLIRHGEAQAAWGGDDDDPGLSEAGRAQAAGAAEALVSLAPAALVCSPMRRCRETAGAFERLAGRESVIEPRVSEVPTPAGVADRRSWLQDNFPWQGGDPRDWATLDPGLKGWRDQMLGCVQSTAADTAIFSHFIAINVLVGAAMGRRETIVCKPGYASITELALEAGRLRLVRLGEEMVAGEVR